ncbi:MAG: hypothetical protein GY828_00100 [Candidatus Gracilibacteria bacterium]|nr:hypothetical protein [Candidatus Gracilibacteria bacterium]
MGKIEAHKFSTNSMDIIRNICVENVIISTNLLLLLKNKSTLGWTVKMFVGVDGKPKVHLPLPIMQYEDKNERLFYTPEYKIRHKNFSRQFIRELSLFDLINIDKDFQIVFEKIKGKVSIKQVLIKPLCKEKYKHLYIEKEEQNDYVIRRSADV